ncbi:hypothetical protein FACS18949_14170 [Clostridia bacterium]|nr:hypothetical protein FACS189425_03190 [Clostridia bacterium]GHV35703.1 hypothetical protein FACS18949_14170 [Clostridia bacterium]
MAIAKANVNVKIDASVKDLATQFLTRMGIDQTTAIDMFYRQIIRERGLPFQPKVEPTLEEQLVAAVAAKNIPTVELESDGKGNIIIDKDKHPELYDWAVNG